MFIRLNELSALYSLIQDAGIKWRMFRCTNHGQGGLVHLVAHNNYVDEYNQKKYWFMRKLQKIEDQ